MADSASSARTVEPPLRRRCRPQPTRMAVGPSAKVEASSRTAVSPGTPASSAQFARDRERQSEEALDVVTARERGRVGKILVEEHAANPQGEREIAARRGLQVAIRTVTVLCATGSIRVSFAPRARASSRIGTRCTLLTIGFFPQSTMFRLFCRSRGRRRRRRRNPGSAPPRPHPSRCRRPCPCRARSVRRSGRRSTSADRDCRRNGSGRSRTGPDSVRIALVVRHRDRALRSAMRTSALRPCGSGGWRSRCGASRSDGNRLVREHRKPRVTGCAGSPFSERSLPSSSSATSAQASGQSRLQVLRRVSTTMGRRV